MKYNRVINDIDILIWSEHKNAEDEIIEYKKFMLFTI